MTMGDLTISARTRSRFGLSLPLVFGLLVYAATVVRTKQILADPDTYWHITLGNWMLVHRSVPHFDHWSFTKAGAPFVPFEWLSEVVIAGVWDVVGWPGLVATAALSVAGAMALLLRFLLRHLLPIHAAIVTALSWNMLLGHTLARPLIFSFPILVLWTGALVAAREQDRTPSYWLAPLMTLWANLHPSYLLGLGLSALFGIEAVLAAADWPARVRAARAWALFGVLALAAALINPFGIWGLVQPLKLLRMPYALAVLSEWQSPNFQDYQPLELWIMVVFAAAFTFRWRLPGTRLVMVLLLLHLALQHGRNVENLGLVAPLLLAPALSYQLEDRRSSSRLLSLLDRGMAELAKPASARGIVLVGALLALISGAALLPRRIPAERADITPAAALAAVAAHHVKGPVFNDYGFGGYLIFNHIKTFIDGRADFYGDHFIKLWDDAVTLRNNSLPGLLKQYGITWTLLFPKEPAVQLIEHLPGWRRLYGDKIAIVDVREDALPH